MAVAERPDLQLRRVGSGRRKTFANPEQLF
jgi:hypothetical protein